MITVVIGRNSTGKSKYIRNVLKTKNQDETFHVHTNRIKHGCIEFSSASQELKDYALNYLPFDLLQEGAGASFVFPVIAAAWLSWYGKQNETTLAIEHPELGLHPSSVSLITKMLVDCALKGVHVIVETHSEVVVNHLGILIEEGKLDKDDIEILLMEKDTNVGMSTVRKTKYDAEGYVRDWPLGFFSG